MRPKVKYAVIHRHRGEYPVSVMCQFFEVSRSGYYDFVKRMDKPEQDAELADIIRMCQRSSDNTYGYRRVWLWLEHKKIHRNPKTVLRIMKKYGLLSEIRRRRKWVNLGQQMHRYDNLLKRQFCADRPNTKWVTDISYIHTKEGILLLLPYENHHLLFDQTISFDLESDENGNKIESTKLFFESIFQIASETTAFEVFKARINHDRTSNWFLGFLKEKLPDAILSLIMNPFQR